MRSNEVRSEIFSFEIFFKTKWQKKQFKLYTQRKTPATPENMQHLLKFVNRATIL